MPGIAVPDMLKRQRFSRCRGPARLGAGGIQRGHGIDVNVPVAGAGWLDGADRTGVRPSRAAARSRRAVRKVQGRWARLGSSK